MLTALPLPFAPVSAQTPPEEPVPPKGPTPSSSPSFYEAHKQPPIRNVDIPKELWPPIPPPTHPQLIGKEKGLTKDGLVTYQAGIETQANETWYGMRMVINGNLIINNNAGTNYVRLTPHVLYKTDHGEYDYVAVVLDTTSSETELQLWTFHKLGDPQYEYEGTISKTSWYEYEMYIDDSNHFWIHYRSYPSGGWILLREGSLDWRISTCAPFLEHLIYSGSPVGHGESWWKDIELFGHDGSPYYWTQDPQPFVDAPLSQTNWLEGDNRQMNTWSTPTVITNDATNITANSAVLNGNLTDLGSASSVNVSFQWGTTTSYGNTTTPQAKTATGSFSANISGLSPNTTYHFRAKAVGDGTGYGSDQQFNTYLAGDGTCDGVVDAVDITKVERVVAQLDPPMCGVDANLDGDINAIDLTKVERIIAELDFKMGTPPKPKSITTVATVSVDAPARVLSGSDFTANVAIAQVTDLDATNWDVVFDPEVLRLDDVTYGTIDGVNIPVEIYNEIEPGRFTVVQNVPDLNGVTGSGNLAVLHFHVLGTEVQTTDITLSEGVLSSILAEGIEATWTGDSVLICPPPTVRAKLQGTRPYPAGFQVPLTLRLYDEELELDENNIMTAEWLYEYTTEDEEIDIFEINQSTKTIRFSVLWDCPDDVYHVTLWDPHVPHSPPYAHTLINLRNGVEIDPSQEEIDMSTLQEGNPNGDEQIAIGDYTLVLADYGATPEDEENWHDGRCDFNHTLQVNGSDLSLLLMNYGEYSPVVVGEGKLGGEETFTKVDMSLKKSEDAKEISAGGTFTVTIEVVCKEQKVDAIDAFLAFDPECLEVVSVKPGNALSTVLANRFDNAKGTITLGMGRDLKAESASGSFTLGTIEFQAKKEAKETRIGFEHEPPRKTDVAYHGESLLGTATDLILEVKP